MPYNKNMIKLLILIASFSLFAETRQKIVVIDTGVSMRQSSMDYMCKGGLQSTHGSWVDTNGHGSNVIGLIAEKINPKKLCIVSIKLDIPDKGDAYFYIAKSIRMAEEFSPVGVNISMAGSAKIESEFRSIVRMATSGVKIVVAAGNDSMNLDLACDTYPACYKKEMMKRGIPSRNFIVVGTVDTVRGNVGSIVTAKTFGKNQGFPKMTGTSQATANFTGKLFSKL